ncbi:MAG: hypothetical protein ACLUSP_01390 [Christensenellales bacterium]
MGFVFMTNLNRILVLVMGIIFLAPVTILSLRAVKRAKPNINDLIRRYLPTCIRKLT